MAWMKLTQPISHSSVDPVTLAAMPPDIPFTLETTTGTQTFRKNSDGSWSFTRDPVPGARPYAQVITDSALMGPHFSTGVPINSTGGITSPEIDPTFRPTQQQLDQLRYTGAIHQGGQGYSDPNGFTGGAQYNPTVATGSYAPVDPALYGQAVGNFVHGAWNTVQPLIDRFIHPSVGESPEQALLRERAMEIEQRAAEQRAEADAAEADWRRDETVQAGRDINLAANSAAQQARQQLGGAAGVGAAAAAGAQAAAQAQAAETPAAIQRARNLKYEREGQMVQRRQAAEASRATGSQVRQQMVSSQQAYQDWIRREREKNAMQNSAAQSTGADSTPGPTDPRINALRQELELLKAQQAAGNNSPQIQISINNKENEIKAAESSSGGASGASGVSGAGGAVTTPVTPPVDRSGEINPPSTGDAANSVASAAQQRILNEQAAEVERAQREANNTAAFQQQGGEGARQIAERTRLFQLFGGDQDATDFYQENKELIWKVQPENTEQWFRDLWNSYKQRGFPVDRIKQLLLEYWNQFRIAPTRTSGGGSVNQGDPNRTKGTVRQSRSGAGGTD